LEKNSLNSKFNNSYVQNQIKKIESSYSAKVLFSLIGKTSENYNGSCNCGKSDFYILITNYITIQSPITCGNCFKSVPLYSLPKYDDDGYMPILSWETNYRACDDLQMNCEVGEMWALNQMQEYKSQLSKQGIKICKRVSELTNTPTFYYLFNYRKVKGDQLSQFCPGCNLKWSLEVKIDDYYDFKCDECCLISTVSQNS